MDINRFMHKWLSFYSKKGLWGLFQDVADEISALDWGIWLLFDESNIYLHADGKVLKKEYTDIQSSVTLKKDNEGQMLIPVYLLKKKIFILEFVIHSITSDECIETQKDKEIQLFIQLLIEHEALIEKKYPSYFPFLFPMDATLREANQVILQGDREIIFLNGQPGTGKKTFFQCYVLFNYNTLIYVEKISKNLIEFSIPSDIKNTGHHQLNNIIFVKEIALLTREQREYILECMVTKEKKNLFIFSSAYDPKMLLERNIIEDDFATICLENRLILPSLKNRPGEVKRILQFFKRTKLRTENFTDMIPRVQDLENNLNALQKLIYSVSGYNASYEEAIEKEIDLRDIIADIEISAIKHAREKAGSSQYQVSKLLGISRGSLQHKLRKYKLPYIFHDD